MKHIYLNILLFLSCLTVTAQNDCEDALVICGDASYAGLDVDGFGTQEISAINSCSGQENNSVWFKVKIDQGGTLGFVLTPDNTDLVVDFDFWVFGPDVECGELGSAVRCSTTNPLQAGLEYNTTGMNDVETETTGGPGPEGNGYVQWMTVEDDEIYYLVIDRSHGDADFSIDWTGTATFNGVYFENTGDETVSYNIVKCDLDGVNDQSTTFDLTIHEATFIGAQENVAITYHLNANDMILGTNAIGNPENFSNTSATKPIYLRMTHTETECFDEYTFNIVVTSTVTAGEPLDLFACDTNGNGIGQFDLAGNDEIVNGGMEGAEVTYYGTAEDAENDENALPALYENTLPYQQELWVRLENDLDECDGYDIKSFTIAVIPLPQFNNPEDIPLELTACGENGTALFDLTVYEEMFMEGQGNITFTYHETADDALNGGNMISNTESYYPVSNPTTIYVNGTDNATGCFAVIEIELLVNDLPEAIQPEPFLLCDYDDENPIPEPFDLTGTIPQIIADQENLKVSFHYSFEDAENFENEIATPEEYMADMIEDVYSRVTNIETGCYRVIVLEFDTVEPPVAETPQIFEGNTPIAVMLYEIDVEAEGSVTWYATGADAESGENPLSENTEITESGTYYVTQTIDGCESEPFEVVIDILLGNDVFTAAMFNYYPNPVTDVFYLKSDKEIEKVLVYNIVGQQVVEEVINQENAEVNMGRLPAGTYVVRAISAEGFSKNIKVVKR